MNTATQKEINRAKEILRNNLVGNRLPNRMRAGIELDDAVASMCGEYLKVNPSGEGNVKYLNNTVAPAAAMLLKNGVLDDTNFKAVNLPVSMRDVMRDGSGFYCHINAAGLKAIDYLQINGLNEAAMVVLNNSASYTGYGKAVTWDRAGFGFNLKAANDGDLLNLRVKSAFEFLVNGSDVFQIPPAAKSIEDLYKLASAQSTGEIVRLTLTREEVEKLYDLANTWFQSIAPARMVAA